LRAIGVTGKLVAASLAGVVADFVDWRGVFVVLGAVGLIVAVAACFDFGGMAVPTTARFNLTAALDGFRSIFADPRAKVCFSAVFVEAVFIHGLFPYIAILLIAAGETRASIAGILIACFGLGGVVYSLSVPLLVASASQRH